MTGTIKKLVEGKGFGFIESSEIDKDVFFHSTALQGVEFTELREGDQVTFETEQTDKGVNAINVSRV